jgi:predicted nucleic acid-binding protein
MNRVFVDTGGFYAALNRRDAHHRDAARLLRRAQREQWFLFTTNFVLAESHALILARMGRERAWNFLQAIVTGQTNVIRAEEADERRARAIIERYQDKAFSYCDAVSFAVMERLNIQDVITFDDHFRQYGQFTIL